MQNIKKNIFLQKKTVEAQWMEVFTAHYLSLKQFNAKEEPIRNIKADENKLQW